MDGKTMRVGLALAAVLGIVLGGCGGGGSDPAADAHQIREALLYYYEHPEAEQCEELTTGRFRAAVYGGNGTGALAACQDHQRARSKMLSISRTAFVNHVRVKGDSAVAEVSAGGIALTEGLVKSDGHWRLDDELSPFHGSSRLPSAGEDQHESGGQVAFGAPARFHNIPGFSPSTAITLVARDPIDPGTDRTGAASVMGRIGNDFGQPGPVQRLRFVNLPITLTNTGSRPFRGDVGVFATTRPVMNSPRSTPAS